MIPTLNNKYSDPLLRWFIFNLLDKLNLSLEGNDFQYFCKRNNEKFCLNCENAKSFFMDTENSKKKFNKAKL